MDKKTLKLIVDGVPYQIPWSLDRQPTDAERSQLTADIRRTVQHRTAVLQVHQPQTPAGIDPVKVAQYKADWFDNPANANSAPAKLLTTLQRLPLAEREKAIPPGWSPVGRAALLQAAYRANPTFPLTGAYATDNNLRELGITREQVKARGIPAAITANQTSRNKLLAEREGLISGPVSTGSGPGASRPFFSADSIYTSDPARAARNRARLQQVNAQLAQLGYAQDPNPPMVPDLGTGSINRAVSSLISGKPPAQTDPSAVSALVDRLARQPGTMDAVRATGGFRGRLASGVSSFAEPESLLNMAALGPVLGLGGKISQAGALLGFGLPSVEQAYTDAKSGDYGGALGDLTAAFGPAAAHYGLRFLPPTQTVAERAFGIPSEFHLESPHLGEDPYLQEMLGERRLPYTAPETPPNGTASSGDRFNHLEWQPTVTRTPSAEAPTDPAILRRGAKMEIGDRPMAPDPQPSAPEVNPDQENVGQTLQLRQETTPTEQGKYSLKPYELKNLTDAIDTTAEPTVRKLRIADVLDTTSEPTVRKLTPATHEVTLPEASSLANTPGVGSRLTLFPTTTFRSPFAPALAPSSAGSLHLSQAPALILGVQNATGPSLSRTSSMAGVGSTRSSTAGRLSNTASAARRPGSLSLSDQVPTTTVGRTLSQNPVEVASTTRAAEPVTVAPTEHVAMTSGPQRQATATVVPPTVPIRLNAGASRALSQALEADHPFQQELNHALRTGSGETTFDLSAQGLQALRTYTQRTQDLPGSYSRNAQLKRIDKAARSLQAQQDSPFLTADIHPKITARGIENGRQLDAYPTQTSAIGRTESSAELTPTQRKVARTAARRGRYISGTTLGEVGTGTRYPSAVGSYRTGSGRINPGTADSSGYGPRLRTDADFDYSGRVGEVQAKTSGSSGKTQTGKAGELLNQDATPSPFPRDAIAGTEAENELNHDWFWEYMACLLEGKPAQVYLLTDVLLGEPHAILAATLPPDILYSPVVLLDNLKDDTAGSIQQNSQSWSGWNIAINARVAIDPADLVYILAEEAMHIARKRKGRSFKKDPKRSYEEQIYEQTAKSGAFYVTGRLPQYAMPLLRASDSLSGRQSVQAQLLEVLNDRAKALQTEATEETPRSGANLITSGGDGQSSPPPEPQPNASSQISELPLPFTVETPITDKPAYEKEFLAKATEYARSLGVDANYGNSVGAARLSSLALAHFASQGLKQPVKIIYSTEPFENLEHGADVTGVAITKDKGIGLNPVSDYYENPVAYTHFGRTKQWSTDHLLHPLFHEEGHVLHESSKKFKSHTKKKITDASYIAIAKRVSGRAWETYLIDEFVAETFAGLLVGRDFDEEIIALYDSYGGFLRPEWKQRFIDTIEEGKRKKVYYEDFVLKAFKRLNPPEKPKTPKKSKASTKQSGTSPKQ